MAIYKRGGVYWYEFAFKGRRIRESTHQGNQRTARQMEAARRAALAKGELGILDRPRVPTLKEFAPQFETEIDTPCAGKPATVAFYREKLRRLLSDAILPSWALDAITEATLDAYKQHRTRQTSRYSPSTIPSVRRSRIGYLAAPVAARSGNGA